MSIHTRAHSPGVFFPMEMIMLRTIVDGMKEEPWFPKTPEMEEKFASYIIRAYDRGLTCPEKLKAFCAVAARLFFHDTPDGKERVFY